MTGSIDPQEVAPVGSDVLVYERLQSALELPGAESASSIGANSTSGTHISSQLQATLCHQNRHAGEHPQWHARSSGCFASIVSLKGRAAA